MRHRTFVPLAALLLMGAYQQGECTGADGQIGYGAHDEEHLLIHDVVPSFVDAPQSSVVAGVALLPFAVNVRALSLAKDDLTSKLEHGPNGIWLELWDATNDVVSPVNITGPLTLGTQFEIFDHTFSDVVIPTPGVYRLSLHCGECTEVAVSGPITVTAAPAVTPQPVKTAYVTCVLATGTATVYGGASESLPSGGTTKTVDGNCTTLTTTSQGDAPTAKAIGTASCVSAPTLNVSCTSATGSCFAAQPTGSAAAGATVTAAWTGGDVPAANASLIAGSIVAVGAAPVTHARTAPLVITLSGGSAAATISMLLSQTAGATSVSTTCVVPANSASVTVPPEVLARFAAGSADFSVDNTTTQIVTAGGFEVTTKVIVNTTGTVAGSLTLQ